MCYTQNRTHGQRGHLARLRSHSQVTADSLEWHSQVKAEPDVTTARWELTWRRLLARAGHSCRPCADRGGELLFLHPSTPFLCLA